MKNLPDEATAYALLRIAFGINFFGHGFIRILNGPVAFADEMAKGFAHSPLPLALVQPFGIAIPFIELALGLGLISGLFSRAAYILGALFMIALTFGTTMKSDWGAAGSQLLYSLVFFVLLFLRRHNTLSLDAWRSREAVAAVP